MEAGSASLLHPNIEACLRKMFVAMAMTITTSLYFKYRLSLKACDVWLGIVETTVKLTDNLPVSTQLCIMVKVGIDY